MSPMKRAFRAENVDIRFDNFKSAGTGYSKTPGNFSGFIR